MNDQKTLWAPGMRPGPTLQERVIELWAIRDEWSASERAQFHALAEIDARTS